MLVDRETGEIKPSYNFGEIVLILRRIDCFHGMNTFLDWYEEEMHLFPSVVKGLILRELMALDRRLEFKFNRR